MSSIEQLYQPISRDLAKTLIALKKPVYYNSLVNNKIKKASIEEVYYQSKK